MAESFCKFVTVAGRACERPGNAAGGYDDGVSRNCILIGEHCKVVVFFLDGPDSPAIHKLHGQFFSMVKQDLRDVCCAVGRGKDATVFFGFSLQAVVGEVLS